MCFKTKEEAEKAKESLLPLLIDANNFVSIVQKEDGVFHLNVFIYNNPEKAEFFECLARDNHIDCTVECKAKGFGKSHSTHQIVIRSLSGSLLPGTEIKNATVCGKDALSK